MLNAILKDLTPFLLGMWLKAQNEMEGLEPHTAMGPVERMVRRHSVQL